MPRNTDDWLRVLLACGVRGVTATRWAPIFASIMRPGTFSAGDDDLENFLGQILHESGKLEIVEESLNYTHADRICAVWPSRFAGIADAARYVRNPPALANKVYGGRMGNTEPGDGFKYRGRGLLQVTGRDNYGTVGDAIGFDLLGNPDALATPEYALRASIAWWEKHIPDSALGDITRETRLVNGGTTGLSDRIALTDDAREALG